MKKFLLTLLAAAALLTALPVYAAPKGAAAASEPEALTVGMPNPYVAYETLPEMKAVLGFDPLFVPRSAGYECTKMYIIGGTIADIRFTGIKDNARSTCGVRSGRIDIAGMDDISGYYSVPWEDVHISQSDRPAPGPAGLRLFRRQLDTWQIRFCLQRQCDQLGPLPRNPHPARADNRTKL